jgi:Fic family protein
MELAGMKRGLQGRYHATSAGGEAVRAFVPAPLPPRPPLVWSPPLRARFDEALLALGRLDATSQLLPDTSLLLDSLVRKEAVLSSMIEGTRSTVTDLLLFELGQEGEAPAADTREVSRYVAALDHGLKRLRGGFPLSSRLIREVHRILMKGGEGQHADPGEYRRTQNWIGGTRPGNAAYVPPPAHEVAGCMSSLERFLHDGATSPLIKAALSHIQFETIHPFLDGNGRVGRLLITLLLCEEGVLKEPLLYLSLYFKQHRKRYYELLDATRRTGDWEAWLRFFADAVLASAEQAVDAIRRLHALAEQDRGRIERLGRAAASALRVHQALQSRPITNTTALVAATGLTPATINKSLVHLERLNVVHRLGERLRGRVFSYSGYVKILNEGTEPFAPARRA